MSLNYGTNVGDFTTFSQQEKINYSLKLALQRIQTDLGQDWYKEPSDYAPKLPNEIYKHSIPDYKSIENYLLVDPDIGDGNECVTNVTVRQVIGTTNFGSHFTLSDVLDTTKVRNNTEHTTLQDTDYVDGSIRKQIKNLSRNMFTRYTYWDNGITGKDSPALDAIADNTAIIDGTTNSGTKNDDTEPFNAFITYENGNLAGNRRFENMNPTRNQVLSGHAVAISIIAPENKDDLSKRHPFLKLYLQVPLYTTRTSEPINEQYEGGGQNTDTIGFHNPVLSRSLGDVNGYLYQMVGWDSTNWSSVTTAYGAAGSQNIMYFLNNPGFIVIYGVKNIVYDFRTSQSYPPMISFLRYEGETFEDGVIAQAPVNHLPLPAVSKDKQLFIDTTNNIIYRFDGAINQWVSIGGGGGSIDEGDTLPDTSDIDEGTLFINTSNNKIYRFDGTNWVSLTVDETNLAKLDSSNVFIEKQTIHSSLDVSGHLHAFGSVTAEEGFINLSDRRVKSNIHLIEDASTKLRKLRGVYYTMGDSRHLGVIAQELKEVIPEAVVKMNNGYYGVEYGNLVGLLIQGFKEQEERLKKLEEKLEELQKE